MMVRATKCLWVISIFFMMCPRRSILAPDRDASTNTLNGSVQDEVNNNDAEGGAEKVEEDVNDGNENQFDAGKDNFEVNDINLPDEVVENEINNDNVSEGSINPNNDDNKGTTTDLDDINADLFDGTDSSDSSDNQNNNNTNINKNDISQPTGVTDNGNVNQNGSAVPDINMPSQGPVNVINKLAQDKALDKSGKKSKLKDILKDTAITLWTGLQNAEPGFDFNEEEMKRLKIWPRGHIPFYIDDFSFDPILQDRLRDIFYAVDSTTGLHFNELSSPPTDENTRWVFFVNRRGVLPCVDYTSKNFTNEGVQKVVLGYDCLSNQKSLGSLILAIAGVPPQHNSPDRNQHIQVILDNVLPDKRDFFEVVPDNEWLFHDIDYDYNSAGHYDLFQYTANGQATIKPLVEDVVIMGEEGLSYGDLWKIRMLYNYITRRVEVLGKSECSKMFAPGRKFNKSPSDGDDDVIPRKKPNKYAGIVEEDSKEKEDADKSTESVGSKEKPQEPEENYDDGANDDGDDDQNDKVDEDLQDDEPEYGNDDDKNDNSNKRRINVK